MPDLLFELGSEELPASFISPALDDLEKLFRAQCAAAGVTHGAIARFGTPRRLALLVEGITVQTEDVTKEVQGPSVKAAFDAAGNPMVPARKFAESVNLPVEQLKRVSTPKGEYIAADVTKKGQLVLELLPAILSTCISKLPFPKSMRWADVEQVYARPLQWIVALFGSDVVPLVFADVRSGRETRGHRFLAPQSFTIVNPSDYECALEAASVIPSLEKRRAMLVERLRSAAAKAQGTLLEDEALVDQVLNLVELPNPVIGTFDERHLDLPAEVLIQEMKGHQRYFSLTDFEGRLLPRFIAVSNTSVKDETASVKGYERVLRARLTDGRFFFDEDRRQPLAARLLKLERRNWIQSLGSMAEKTERIRQLALFLARAAGKAEQEVAIDRAAVLCKCDLETLMVGEFPELQGIMGREYALHDGESREVALAISEHYLPRGAGDSLPTHDAGAFIGLADRLDSLCGLFAIGKKPTGAKDEYALRRAAIAVINLVIGRNYRLSLSAAVDESLRLLAPKLAVLKKPVDASQVRSQVLDFVQDRLRPLWKEEFRADLIEAVVAAGADDLVATRQRACALSASVSRPDFVALAATFKRVANIVEKQRGAILPMPVDRRLFEHDAESALFEATENVRTAMQAAIKRDDYSEVLAKVAPLRPLVDGFFDQVMVMAEEKSLRENRLRLLLEIGLLFSVVADFSKLQFESSAA